MHLQSAVFDDNNEMMLLVADYVSDIDLTCDDLIIKINIMKTKQILLIAIICLFPRFLFSQEKGRIIYTDFEPDSIFAITYNQRVFDINYDSIPDFKFIKVGTSGGDYNHIEMYDNWSVGCCLEDTDTISLYNINNWDYYWWMIYFEGDYSDYNFALKHYVKGVGLYYGWIRLRYQFDYEIRKYTITLHDMAYCTIPNCPLMFGQKDFEDIEENEYATANASLFPNPAEDKLSLQVSGNVSCKNVEIYGIDGRMLKSQNEDFENIDVSNLSSGLYIAKIKLSDGNVFTEKVVVK